MRLPSRRWLLLASCLMVGGFALLCWYVAAAYRYHQMLARYQDIRVGMSRSEVRAAVGWQVTSASLDSTARIIWNVETDYQWEPVAWEGSGGDPTTCDVWLDKEAYLMVWYRGDGKASGKCVMKSVPYLMLTVDYWLWRLGILRPRWYSGR
jgi:hypothetical protein